MHDIAPMLAIPALFSAWLPGISTAVPQTTVAAVVPAARALAGACRPAAAAALVRKAEPITAAAVTMARRRLIDPPSLISARQISYRPGASPRRQRGQGGR